MTPPPPPPPPATASREPFTRLDADGAGNNTTAELPTAQQRGRSPGSTSATSSTDDVTSLFNTLDADSSGGVSADELTAALTPDSSRQQQTTTQATEALNRMVAALSDRYNLNSSATAGKYVSTSA